MKTVNLSKIIELVNTGNYSKAEIGVIDLVKNQPKNFSLNKIYGVTLLGQQKYLQAIEIFENCFNMKKDDFDVNVNLAYLYSKTQDHKKSLIYARNANTTDENRPEPYQNMADSYLNLGKYNEAEKYILIAINKRGGLNSKEILKYHDTLNLYANILLAKKEEEKFCEFAFSILDKGNHISQLLISLIRIDTKNMKDAYLEKMYDILKNIYKIKSLALRSTTESNIHFILAEYFQKDDKGKSEKFYMKANQIIASLQRGSLFERQKRVKKIIDYYKSYKALEPNSNILSNKGEGLVFIIGMPRSGTTLVESIVSTANNCVTGGEKLFFSLECNKLLDDQNIQLLDKSFFQKLGDKYLAVVDVQRENKKFFIDKLPENFLYFAFIKKALPGAKFIHIYRDPWDNAISLFKQNYSLNLFYSSSFFGIAMEYANYEHIMDYWYKIDEENILINIKYEDLVSKTDVISKKIWHHCDLEGEYNERKRDGFFSLTASKQQVNKDIYQTSIDKNDFDDLKSKFYEDLNQQRKYWTDNNHS